MFFSTMLLARVPCDVLKTLQECLDAVISIVMAEFLEFLCCCVKCPIEKMAFSGMLRRVALARTEIRKNLTPPSSG
jgi:hypothetical protein